MMQSHESWYPHQYSIFRTIHLPLQKLRQEFRTVLGNAAMVTQAEDEPEPSTSRSTESHDTSTQEFYGPIINM